MAEVTWIELALQDLKQIYKYISEDSVYYAGRFILKLVAGSEMLEKHPYAGRVVPEKEDETIRELIEGNYRIFYKVVSENEIYVLRIHHGARNI